MSGTVEARKRWDAHDLSNAIDRFIEDNKNADSLNLRWLASRMELAIVEARLIRNGDPSREMNIMIHEFRLNEIEQKKSIRYSEIHKFEEEASTLQRQLATLTGSSEDA